MGLALNGFDGKLIEACRLYQRARHLDAVGDVGLDAVREVFEPRGYPRP